MVSKYAGNMLVCGALQTAFHNQCSLTKYGEITEKSHAGNGTQKSSLPRITAQRTRVVNAVQFGTTQSSHGVEGASKLTFVMLFMSIRSLTRENLAQSTHVLDYTKIGQELTNNSNVVVKLLFALYEQALKKLPVTTSVDSPWGFHCAVTILLT